MLRNYFLFRPSTLVLLAGGVVAPLFSPFSAQAETKLDTVQPAVEFQDSTDQLVEPIFRIDHEAPVGEPAKLALRIPVAKAQPPFDLTQRPGEHPLMPALRMATKSLKTIDARILDYNAVLMKQERIDGVLGPKEVAYLKVRHQPFGVYMFFLGKSKGRECLYSTKPDGSKGNLIARECGFTGRLGKFTLDPEGRLAMKGQKYPIMKIGIRELTKELILVASNDVKFGECEVTHGQGTMEGRAITWLQVVHPVKRTNFRFYKAQIFIDNELQIPVRYIAYTWPTEPGGKPLLEESYTYLKLKINNGYTDIDFDQNNPAYFKR